MDYYYVDTCAQLNGDHEVHKEECEFIPDVANRIFLGLFVGCHEAVRRAKDHYATADGCKHCSPDCHTR
jgi:hypothetical protein